MSCSAAAERKEENRLRHRGADDGFIWQGNESKIISEHTGLIGEREPVNQSATYSPLLACARVTRMSGGLPLPLPQESSEGDSQRCMEQRDSLSPGPHCWFLLVSIRWFSESKHMFSSSFKQYFSFIFSSK